MSTGQKFLLTEILKQSPIPSAYLYSIVREQPGSPQWLEIPLPPGRSVTSCKNAFFRMEQDYTYSQHHQSLPGPTNQLQISPGSRKRALAPSQLDKSAAQLPRAIQPKPLSTPGPFGTVEMHSPVQMSPTTTIRGPTGEPPRKRGRPSKAEQQRRLLMAQAQGQQYPAPKRPIPRSPFTEPAPQPPAAESVSLMSSKSHPTESRAPQMSPGMGTGVAPRPDPITGQAHDVQMQGVPQQRIAFGPPLPTTTAGMAMGESTPRTILDNQMPQSSSSLPPSFRGINQPGSIPASPRPETPAVSSAATAESGGGTPQAPPAPGGPTKT
ncbi:hypothetical protein AJ80_08168 [Polytolypa hystricis UAMH7299]|uniref:Uncharacterized protein n=1 Tax=Polytolypa hystricis (strain UAMH7299) TaxID=1447883 RepID=A0A2B7X4A8_POLH7|nr:hypothetical protein AJ80_08168 [Polytolypa hystricis UAMH7299]